MSQLVPVAGALKGEVALGEQVTVRGWLRSKRDSKAGISFLAVHDGSSFDPIQAVVPNTLANYEEEVLHLSTGCSVVVSGELVASEGKGQSVEIQAGEVQVVGMVDDPESYPIAKKRHAHHPGQRHPQLFSRSWLPLDQHAHHHRQRLRGGR
jgi:asparaginyl-tRNA synthetase